MFSQCSSGAHVASLLLIRHSLSKIIGSTSFDSVELEPAEKIRGFIGLSGVYDIAAHYEV